MTRRTGAAATRTVDNFTAYRVAVVLLSLAVAGGAVGSVEGLLHAGSWAEPSWLQWTLPVAVDVFLVGTALATLMLRERRAFWSAGFCAVVTLGLVAFSAVMNYQYVLSITTAGTIEHTYGPFIKGSMPVLLLLALEIIAALTSTRNNKANSPLNRAKADAKRWKVRAMAAERASKPERVSRGRAVETVEVQPEKSGRDNADRQREVREAEALIRRPLPMLTVPPSPVQIPLDMSADPR